MLDAKILWNGNGHRMAEVVEYSHQNECQQNIHVAADAASIAREQPADKNITAVSLEM
jgi:hypothetical protein